MINSLETLKQQLHLARNDVISHLLMLIYLQDSKSIDAAFVRDPDYIIRKKNEEPQETNGNIKKKNKKGNEIVKINSK